MRINELSKIEMITYLSEKGFITPKEMQKLFLNTPKYEVEKVFIKYLDSTSEKQTHTARCQKFSPKFGIAFIFDRPPC